MQAYLEQERERLRIEVLSKLGAPRAEIAGLLEYSRNVFQVEHAAEMQFPLADEPFVEPWRRYVEVCRRERSILPLTRFLLQLQFPVRAGISREQEYRTALIGGGNAESGLGPGCQLEAPHQGQVEIYPTPAGNIPIITAGSRDDFVFLVRALSHRNEPHAIPDSMGACMIAGFTNWTRLADLRDSPRHVSPIGREQFQDRFIVLSDGPYSGVQAADIGFQAEEWARVSLIIRREHECTHYFTRRVFQSMRNNLLDELVADYFGILAAQGAFRSDWATRFFGIHEAPANDTAGRFWNYVASAPLSSRSIEILIHLVKRAACNLEQFDSNRRKKIRSLALKPALLMTLAAYTLEELASEQAVSLLSASFNANLQTATYELAGQS